MTQTRTAEQTVFVVDDDVDVRDSLQWLLSSVGLHVETFASADAFFQAAAKAPLRGCILMDVRMPGMSGLAAQTELEKRAIHLPLIMISGHADVDMAVTAMTQGALTFLQKPFSDQKLIDHVYAALEQEQLTFLKQTELAALKHTYSQLTRRERQVFDGVVAGLANQEIADQLSINRKTVEGHRANMVAKMGAGSLSELVQMSVKLGLASPFR